MSEIKRSDFGEDFYWGVSTSAYQNEGGFDSGGKGLSIWDEFCGQKGKILNDEKGDNACEFYHRYEDDLTLMHQMGIRNFRFSLSWPRILPKGTGEINEEGITFYNNLIDKCLSHNITPWITLYHWGLPAHLEAKGGWTNRQIIEWFSEYVVVCVETFGDRVKNWMVLNEPMVFTGAGYFLGVHAPGKKGLNKFLAAAHHAVLCQAEGGRIIRNLLPEANIGTTFSCSYIEPLNGKKRHVKAAKRVDALLNRLFLEPALGLGYPFEELKLLKRIEKFYAPGDEEKMRFDFDFIGVQNYTREIIKYSFLTPFINARIIKAGTRNVPVTLMDWEVYPQAIYEMLKKFNAYPQIRELIITENGAAFTDKVEAGQVIDPLRKEYLMQHMTELLKAKLEGVKVKGYFIWTFMDNFEWAEGFYPRFGIVYVDFKTQQRIIKASGKWFKEFLKGDSNS